MMEYPINTQNDRQKMPWIFHQNQISVEDQTNEQEEYTRNYSCCQVNEASENFEEVLTSKN